MKQNLGTISLFTILALFGGYLMILPAAQAAGVSGTDSKEVSQLLDDTKQEAHELELDTVALESFTRSGLTSQSHAVKLNEIKDHINKAGKLLTKLHDMREEGAPWQQKAIDEIEPLLKELAANTKSAMDYFNDNKDRFHMGTSYQNYLKANCGLARDLAALITDYVDYGFHKSAVERLGEKVVATER